MKSSTQNPYLFVVGCPRSGTTLMQRMLDHHPQLAVANDSHFIPRAIEAVAIGVDPALTPELVEWVRSYRRFYRLGLSDAAVYEAAAEAHTYREFVSALYSEHGRIRGKPLAGEKTPDYVRHLSRLHALFPWVRTIHIIRDGRDVALSTLEWAREDKGPGKFELWQEEPMAVCALWWRWQVSTGQREATALSPAQYHEVIYENLVAQPEEILRAVADFLDLPFAQEMLTYYEGNVRNQPGLSAKKAWLPPTPGLRDWRTQMTERDLELFEALAGDLLTALGYERGVTTISQKVMAVAERCRQWWESTMARREGSASQPLEPAEPRVENDSFSGARLHPAAPPEGMSTALSPDDVDLIQRDPALLGLATVLDPAAFLAALRRSLPEADLKTARIIYIRYKPGTNCLVGYQLEVSGETVEAYSKAYGPDAEIKLRNACKRPALSGPLGPGRIVLEDCATVVFIFPNDRKVKALPNLVDLQARQRLFRQLFPTRPDLWNGTVHSLAYKPERRYVAELLADNGERAVVKAYAGLAYPLAQGKAEALEPRPSLRIARQIVRSDQHCLLVLEWLPGRVLSEALSIPKLPLEAVAATGAALAELHAQPGDRLTPLTRDAEAVNLLEVANGLRSLCPHLARRADDIAWRLAAQLGPAPPMNRPIHGDFYARQVLFGDEGVALLDLDEAVRGDPAADLGNFIAHLHRDALRHILAPNLVDSLRDALLEGYRWAANRAVPDRIELYTAVSLFRLAHDPFRHREPNWPERTKAILEHVETILETLPEHTKVNVIDVQRQLWPVQDRREAKR